MDKAKPISQIEKDAARYRMLRSMNWFDGGFVVLESVKDARLGCMTLSMERLDKAIDDELQKQIEAEEELVLVR